MPPPHQYRCPHTIDLITSGLQDHRLPPAQAWEPSHAATGQAAQTWPCFPLDSASSHCEQLGQQASPRHSSGKRWEPHTKQYLSHNEALTFHSFPERVLNVLQP